MSSPPSTALSSLSPDTPPSVVLARDRLARHATPFIWNEAARRMAERLALLRLVPALVLDVGCAWGDGLALLRRQYPRARLVGVEPSPRLAAAARRTQGGMQWLRGLRGQGPTEIIEAPLERPGAGAQMLWSNLALPWARDPGALFEGWLQALQPEGVLMFTTFGPDTLRELRTPAIGAMGIVPPSYPDMHDLGDMLMGAGFAEPVMDMEMIHLRWADPARAFAELAELGRPPHGALPGGLRTPRAWTALREAVRDATGQGGGVELSIELVYGHAFKPATRKATQGVATFDVETLRASARKR